MHMYNYIYMYMFSAGSGRDVLCQQRYHGTGAENTNQHQSLSQVSYLGTTYCKHVHVHDKQQCTSMLPYMYTCIHVHVHVHV